MKRCLCLWLPNWPIQRRLAERPELQRGAAVILHEPGESTRNQTHVVACCDRAARRGVRAGMPLADAISRWPGRDRPDAAADQALHVETCSKIEERAALEELARWCDRFSPRVAVEEADRAESLFLDATGLTPLFSSEAGMARKVIEALAARRLIARAAVADTPGAAWAVAHYDARAAGAPLVVDAGRSRRWLEPLPVAALRLDRQCVEQLMWLGIEQLEQLLAIPRTELASRFGGEILWRIDQALGLREEPLGAVSARPRLAAQWSWDFPVDDCRTVETVLERLARQLAGQLLRRGHGALRLVCRLQGAAPRTITVGMLEPSASAEHWWELLRLRLQQVQLDGPVEGVWLEVTEHGPLVVAERRLFETDLGADDRRELARLIDRLSGRLGARAVGRVRLLAEAQPERAYRLERISAQPAPSKNPATFGSLDRPLRLWRPELLKVPAAHEGRPPQVFRFRGNEYRVVRFWGPERIETGWWRRRGVRRDYYRVETSDGQRFWLFRSLDDSRWFVQGEFV